MSPERAGKEGKTNMKRFKTIMALVLAVIMTLVVSSVAVFAAGTGSIKVKNATKGYDYKAYKVFDATYTGTGENLKVSYKTPSANASKLDSSIFGWSTAADSDGNISVWVKDGVLETDVHDWVKEHYSEFGGTAIDGVWDDANSTVTFSGLDFGYYYITSGLGSVVTIDSAIPNATVYDKNETTPVAPVKKIVSVDGTAQSEVTSANAHVGSVVGFKLAGSTNNWIDKDTIRTFWSITDTPTNMTIDMSTLVVKFNGTALETSAYTATVDSTTGALSINVPMTDDNGNSIYPANLGTAEGLIPIEITYSATITKDAGSNPAKNEIPGSRTEVFTYAFQIAKTDDKNAALPGAQFELWSAKGGATEAKLTFIDNGDGTYTYSPTGNVTTLDMTTNTTISIKGLDKSWSYILKEVTVPDGYNQAADVTIAGSSLTKVTEGMDTSMTSTALFKETVVNKAGVELPSTGGIGTTVFYILGSLLVVGCGIVLISIKRMQNTK